MLRYLQLNTRPFNTNIGVQYAEIAQEMHQDGTPHLHIFLLFKATLNIKSPVFFDNLATDGTTGQTYHANIGRIDSIPGTLDYIRKTDKATLTYGSLPFHVEENIKSYHKRGHVDKGSGTDSSSDSSGGKKQKNTGKCDDIAIQLKGGATFQDLNESHPGFILNNLKKLREYKAFLEEFTTRDHLKPFLGLTYSGEDATTITIVNWINLNLLQKREHKQAQLYLSGPPNSGKTSLVRMLEEYLSVYWMPFINEYCTGYSDEAYDLVCFDEFSGPNKFKDQPFINQFIEGVNNVQLPNRYAGMYKKKNQPVIILSNFELAANYTNPDIRAQMQARVIEVKISKECPIDYKKISFIQTDI